MSTDFPGLPFQRGDTITMADDDGPGDLRDEITGRRPAGDGEPLEKLDVREEAADALQKLGYSDLAQRLRDDA